MLASLAFSETTRIEQKFSRYRADNIVHAINHGDGSPVAVDEETAHLLTYAGQCYDLSGGLFDITSGVLRRAWKFDGRVVHPDQRLIDTLRELVGWTKVRYDGASITLLAGMEIDFGGIGKEYAVDRVAQLVFGASGRPVMVNFGGDIRACSAETDPHTWDVGIEDPLRHDRPLGLIALSRGAVTTSGDAHRCCYVDGQRLGHILDPRTGWPAADAPQSVTVLGEYCTEAGLLSTLAILQGANAESFLSAQGVVYHCVR